MGHRNMKRFAKIGTALVVALAVAGALVLWTEGSFGPALERTIVWREDYRMRVPHYWSVLEHGDDRYDGLSVNPRSGPHSRFWITVSVAGPAFWQDLAAREAMASDRPGGWREHARSPSHWRTPPPRSEIETITVADMPVEIWRTDVVTEVSKTRHPEVIARAQLGDLVVTSWVSSLKRPGRWNRDPFLTDEQAESLSIRQADFEAAVVEVMSRFLRANPTLVSASATRSFGSAEPTGDHEVQK